MNTRLLALVLALTLPACDRVIWYEGQPGERGLVGAPGPVGPEGSPAAVPGTRLRPEWLTTDDGARAWLGSWRDTARGESCTFLPAEEDGLLRCLPVHRTQQSIPAFATADCAGSRASQVHEPGYIRESESGTFYKLGAPIAEAWGGEGCTYLGAGPWYAWEAVAWDAFVAGELEAD